MQRYLLIELIEQCQAMNDLERREYLALLTKQGKISEDEAQRIYTMKRPQGEQFSHQARNHGQAYEPIFC